MYLMRLLIVGETGVGKTSLLVRFNEGMFLSDQKTTIGVDYKAKEIKVDQDHVKLQIWDTAGQERFRSMTAAFYGKAQGVVVTFDVSERESFRALPSWIRDVREYAPRNCTIVLCANKTDLPAEMWAVSREEFAAFARDNQFVIVEASAANDNNVTLLFVTLAREILKYHRQDLSEVHLDDGKDRGSIILQEYTERSKRKKACCDVS